MVGHPSWPWAISPIDPAAEPLSILPETMLSEFRDLKGRACLIIGLGSLGGVAADTLYKLGANLVLIDGKEVSGANPIRQIYGLGQAGRPKAQACVEMLADIQSNEVVKNESNGSWSWRRGNQSVIGYQAEITRELKEERTLSIRLLLRGLSKRSRTETGNSFKPIRLAKKQETTNCPLRNALAQETRATRVLPDERGVDGLHRRFALRQVNHH